MRHPMTTNQIQFTDGAAYERYMGQWSRLVGGRFLDWLAPASGLRWLDVGCGNGAFTEMIAERCQPSAVHGVDPSAAQIDYARQRPALEFAAFQQGDAMALPFDGDSFDVAVMPLVIFFVPDPAAGVAEMGRVVRRGGLVSAYAWDIPGGGFPYAVLQEEMRALGAVVPLPPSPDASALDAMRELWAGAHLEGVETTAITVTRTFADFNDYWTTILGSASAGRLLAAMPADDQETLKSRLRSRLPADDSGRITCEARANAAKGRVR
jgi:SAM-dependent methyltransferase